MVHDALVSGEDKSSELTGGEHGGAEVLEVLELDVEVGGDHTALVQSSVEVDDDLASAGVVDDLELTDVSVGLHDLEELHEGLGDGSQNNLQSALVSEG